MAYDDRDKDRRYRDRDGDGDRGRDRSRGRDNSRERDRSRDRDRHRDGRERRDRSRDRYSCRNDRHSRDEGRYRDHDRDNRNRSRSPDTRHSMRNDHPAQSSSHHIQQISSPHDTQKKLEIAIHPLLSDSKAPEIKAKTSLIPSAGFATVKANIRAGQKDSTILEQQQKKKKPFDPTLALLSIKPPDISKNNPYFDKRLSSNIKKHAPRPINFVEQGKYIAEADLIRTEQELERLRREVAETLGQVGLDTEIVSDLLQAESVPSLDWWDIPFVGEDGSLKLDQIGNLIQRPALLPPPVDGDTLAQPKPLMLTTEERKKLRRQRRLAEHKEKQEQIKLGLLPAEPQKVRIANIARILGTQSVQEPSKLETEIRAQAQKRYEEHLKQNEDRSIQAKEAALQKNKQKEKELAEMLGVGVIVFKIKQLDPPQWKFKVVKNAQQNQLTGCVLYYKDFNLIIVEGTGSGLRRYKHLLKDRINWKEAPLDSPIDVSENYCNLVWEGTIRERLFNRFRSYEMSSEVDAREFLSRFGIEHYWKLVKES